MYIQFPWGIGYNQRISLQINFLDQGDVLIKCDSFLLCNKFYEDMDNGCTTK